MNESIDRIIAVFVRGAIKEKVISNKDSLDRRTAILADKIRNQGLAAEIALITKKVRETMKLPRGHESAAEALGLIEDIKRREWPLVAEVIYPALLTQLQEIDAKRLVSLAPTSKTLLALCKKTPSAKKILNEMAGDSPDQWLNTAAGDWLFERAKIPRLQSAFIAALELKKRPAGLKAPDELRQSAVQRDKKGDLLFAVINNVSDSGSLARFGLSILSKPRIAKTYLTVVTSSKGRKKMTSSWSNFLTALVSASLASDRFRKTASLLMIAVYADLLLTLPQDEPTPDSADSIIKALDHLVTAAESDDAKENTWTIHPLKTDQLVGVDAKIDLDAARILKIAFEQTDRGANAIDILEAMAFNLGLRPIGEPDSMVTYDPRLHEDPKGGLHPGDTVKVMRKGWTLNDSPIVRAKVFQTD